MIQRLLFAARIAGFAFAISGGELHSGKRYGDC
jgi:hypothetical protein